MRRGELLALAFERLADAVGALLREGGDPAAYVFTAADADSPVGELLLRHNAAAGEDAVCLMLAAETLSRILEAYAFDPASARRLATWLANAPAAGRYRVVAIGRAGVAAVTVDTTGEETDETPVSRLPN